MAVNPSELGALLGGLTGRDPALWDIQEGSYNGVLFHVFQSATAYRAGVDRIQDVGGRRKVKYLFPYKDGQTTDDLGRQPTSFDVNILLSGARYLTGLQLLEKELNKPTPGDLVHPVLGKIQVVPEEVTRLHESAARRAVALRVTFIEHNFSVGTFRALDDNSVKGALARALDAFNLINDTLNRVQQAALLPQAIKNTIVGSLANYRNRFGAVLTAINQTFNLQGSADIPTLLPVNDGGTRLPDGEVETDRFPTVRSPSDPFSNVPVETVDPQVQQALAVSQLTNEVNETRELAKAINEDLKVAPLTIQTAPKGPNNEPLPQQGSLEFFDNILAIEESAVLLQNALEAGVASSQTQIVQYVTPRTMSLREICFENGVDVNNVGQLDILNIELESTNEIPKSTTVKVPVTR